MKDLDDHFEAYIFAHKRERIVQHPAACDPAYPVILSKMKRDMQDRKRQDRKDLVTIKSF